MSENKTIKSDKKFLKSPIFCAGNKYRLLNQLIPLFPKECDVFYDVFGGSGCVSGNYRGKIKTIYNEFNRKISMLYEMIKDTDPDELIGGIERYVAEYGLSAGNKERYLKFREFYNNYEDDFVALLTLTFYCFSNQMRFNAQGGFNQPIGCGSFCQKHKEIIREWCNAMKGANIEVWSTDFVDILNKISPTRYDFVYCDPPYSNSWAGYNEERAFGGWSIDDDYKLFEALQALHEQGAKWGMSNVFKIRGITNYHLIEWCKACGWRVYHLKIKYASNGRGFAENDEVYICNY